MPSKWRRMVQSDKVLTQLLVSWYRYPYLPMPGRAAHKPITYNKGNFTQLCFTCNFSPTLLGR